MNFEIHLHLNSELASNEFLTEFALNLHSKIASLPSGFDLVRQFREQATVDKTNASMSEGGHALIPHFLILKWLHPVPPLLTTHTPPPLPQSSQVVQSASLFAGIKSENSRSFLLSSVNNIL